MNNLQNRIANIERLRVLAAFGIVWFHTPAVFGRLIGYAGLPVFLMVFAALLSFRPKHDSLLKFTKKRASRLIKPWLFWSVVYFGLFLAKKVLSDSNDVYFSISMLLTGPSIHLWFLPYAFAASVIIFFLQSWTTKICEKKLILVSSFLGLCLLLMCSIIMSLFKVPVPLAQWIFGLPAIVLGIAIGRLCSVVDNEARSALYLGIIVLIAIIGCSGLAWFGYSSLIVPYSIAIFLVSAAFVWKGELDPISHKWASLTFGIYLIHPLLFSILHYVLPIEINPWLMIFVVFLLSSVVTLLMKKTPLRQFV